ncbi:MAG TPA: polysaccharide pyruvyl transferase family protein [Anaerolineales bacterium]|nr:polysaccharide pyruvyl transferase family protein [Anaerolineales bacterium]
MKFILIGGYYGAGNLGDEAILECMLKDMRALRSDLHFIVTSWNPKRTSEHFNVEAFHWKDIPAMLEAGTRADLVILGGGGLLQDYWGIKPETYLRRAAMDITAYGSLPLLAEMMDIPCMMYAMGLGPLHSDLALEHTRLAFNRSLVATLRDEDSLELLRTTGFQPRPDQTLELTADPVFTLTASEKDDEDVTHFLAQKNIEDDAELIAVSLRYWDRAGSLNDWLPRIADGINRYLAANDRAQIILLPFQSDSDNPYTDDVAVLKHIYQFISATWRVHLVEEQVTPQFAQALFKRCSVILGMRLHALILGINVGTPVIALPYDPKVSSLMKQAGLENYTCSSIAPESDELAGLLKKAFEHRNDLNQSMLALGGEKRKLALKNAEYALGLLNVAPTAVPGGGERTLTFAQQYAIETLLQLEKTDEKLEQVQAENEAARERIQELEKDSAQLREIESSKFWKLAKSYYRLAQDSPLRYGYQFLGTLRREGAKSALRQTARAIRTKLTPAKAAALPVTYVDESAIDPTEVVRGIVRELSERKLKGVFVVTSAFPFDELYNQRVINLSKFLAAENWGVLYVAWRWTKDEKFPGVGQEVYKNIFQIPVDMFLENLFEMSGVVAAKKYFVVEFPHPEFFAAALRMRKYNFGILYEIIDDWEEFHKVGMAIWFNKGIEEAMVLNANLLTAVSPPLVEKFSGLRRDIHLSPNGFDPALLGMNQRGVAKRNFKNNQINIGYFGHLTESWFDWDFIFSTLALAEKEKVNLHFHLIGYGEPNLQGKLEAYQGRVTFYGKVQPADLWSYAMHWDAGLICFKTNTLSQAVDPIKIYEYAYFGLPVLAKGIEHLKTFPSAQVIETEAQFLNAVRILQTDPKKAMPSKSEMDSALATYTWKRRFSDLLTLLEGQEWIF